MGMRRRAGAPAAVGSRFARDRALARNRILVAIASKSWRAAGRERRPRLRRPALQSAARRRPAAARTTRGSTASTTTGTSSPSFADYDRFSRAWLAECRRILKPDGAHLGDRLLPQHLPPRRRAAGPRLLDPERRRLAQDQPDAELPRQALHQRARDADLGGARSASRAYTFNYESLKALQRRPADALRLAVPDLLRPRAAEGRRRPQGAPDAEAGSAAASRAARLDQARRRRARSVLRHRHDRRRRQAARPPLHRHRARPRLRRGRRGAHRQGAAAAASALETVRSQARRAARAVRHHRRAAACSSRAPRCSMHARASAPR